MIYLLQARIGLRSCAIPRIWNIPEFRDVYNGLKRDVGSVECEMN
jgi:hypothetical protein